jgi:protein-disulfide isomerase
LIDYTCMNQFGHIILPALLLSSLLLVVGCVDRDTARLEAEVEHLKSELRALKQIKYDIRTLEAELSSLKGEIRSNNTEDRPISEVRVKADGSHLDDPFIGPKEAPLIMMAFVDYQCRPCRQFYSDSFWKLKEEFTDPGHLRFIFRDFPLSSHRYAQQAATLAHCAGEQSNYWQAFEALFENQQKVDSGSFEELESQLEEVDLPRLKKCTASERYHAEAALDMEEGKRFGAKGAPGFFIGHKNDEGWFSGVFVRGAQPYPVLRTEIEKALSRSGEPL